MKTSSNIPNNKGTWVARKQQLLPGGIADMLSAEAWNARTTFEHPSTRKSLSVHEVVADG